MSDITTVKLLINKKIIVFYNTYLNNLTCIYKSNCKVFWCINKQIYWWVI